MVAFSPMHDRARHPSLAAVWCAPRWRPAWIALLLALVVFVGVMALRPFPPLDVSLGWDKLNHGFAFLALGVAALKAFPSHGRLALAALLFYGGAIELLQTGVPGRSADWTDLGADALGLALAAPAEALVTRQLLLSPD